MFRGASQRQRPHQMSKIEVKESSEKCSMGIRLMIIELGNYNSAEELLIETRTIGSQGHVCYQNRNRRASVTRAAVHMGLEGTGCKQGIGAHTNGVRVRNEHRDADDNCGAIKEALAH